MEGRDIWSLTSWSYSQGGKGFGCRNLDGVAEVTKERCAETLWKKGEKLSGPESRKQGGVLTQGDEAGGIGKG